MWPLLLKSRVGEAVASRKQEDENYIGRAVVTEERSTIEASPRHTRGDDSEAFRGQGARIQG